MSSSSFDRVRIEAERQAQLERERQIRINMAADLEKARSHASVALHRVGNKYNELIEQARGDPMLLGVVKEIDLIRKQFREESEAAALLHTSMPVGVVDHEGYLSRVAEATKAAQAVNPERMEQQLGFRLKRNLEEIKRQFAAYNQSATVRKAVFNHKDLVYMLDEETLQSVLQEPVSKRLSALKFYGEQVLAEEILVPARKVSLAATLSGKDCECIACELSAAIEEQKVYAAYTALCAYAGIVPRFISTFQSREDIEAEIATINAELRSSEEQAYLRHAFETVLSQFGFGTSHTVWVNGTETVLHPSTRNNGLRVHYGNEGVYMEPVRISTGAAMKADELNGELIRASAAPTLQAKFCSIREELAQELLERFGVELNSEMLMPAGEAVTVVQLNTISDGFLATTSTAKSTVAKTANEKTTGQGG